MSDKQKYKKDSFTGKKGKHGTEGNELKYSKTNSNEIRTKIFSLKSSNFSKFYPNPLKLCTCQEI